LDLGLGAGRALGAVRHRSPIMLIELREIALLAAIVGSLSILSVGVAIAVAFAL
jgi:hypothetical protein